MGKQRIQYKSDLFEWKTNACVTIQKVTKMHQARNQFKSIQNATLTLQTVIRAWKSRIEFKEHQKRKDAVRRISAWYEKRKEIRSVDFTWFKHRMVSVQDYYRRHKAKKDNAATLIKAAFKRAQAMKEYKKQKQASILLQSFWRAKNTMINRTPEMKKICRRLDKANAEWTEELSIGYRTTKALKIIQKSNRLHEIIEACTMLDTITRLSIDVCELLVKVNVVKKLMGLIGELNRSLPVYTAIKLSLTIVYHIIVAKESLAHEIMQLPTTLETIESLMLRLSPKIVSDNTQDPIIDILIAASPC